MSVSIHAPAWGATLRRRSVPLLPTVSIHAPAWGATASPDYGRWTSVCFNPRARMGRDYPRLWAVGKACRFNPRARMGRDHLPTLSVGFFLQVSIHAPAWGATSIIDK